MTSTARRSVAESGAEKSEGAVPDEMGWRMKSVF